MTHRDLLALLSVTLCVALTALPASGQDAAPPVADDGMIALNFPEVVEVQALVDYVAARQKLNLIYDVDVMQGKKITLRVPQKVPADSLLTLLDSALRMTGLSISETEVAGMYTITPAKPLTDLSPGPNASATIANPRPTMVVSRLVDIKHVALDRANTIAAPHLSSEKASIVLLPEHRQLLITDYVANVTRMEEMIALVDRPRRATVTEYVTVEHLEPEAAVESVEQMLDAKDKAAGLEKAVKPEVFVEERTGKIVVIGARQRVDEVLEVIKSVDVPLGLDTRVYSFKVTEAGRVDRLVRTLIGEAKAKRFYHSAIEKEFNLLVATTTEEVHAQIATVIESADREAPESQSPIRFYKLENARALDVLDTLRSIEGGAGLGGVSVDGVTAEATAPTPTPAPAPTDTGPTLDAPTASQINRRLGPEGGDLDQIASSAVNLPDARVLADEPTNTIIVIASPSIHPIYEKLIRRLDIRRPQVLIEATIVSLDTSDNFQLGVEIYSEETGVDGGSLLTFSRLGISASNAVPGLLGVPAGLGFTAALLDSDTAEVIVRAMESDARTKVVSRPSVLVNDNATGTLTSDDEEPFTTTTVPANGNQTTTFGGFAAAGTSITVTPQISEGNHLKLEYDIALSSFGERIDPSIPPARATDTLVSEATIPDDFTIVVGGLTDEDYRETINRVPLLGHIPVLEFLFSNRTTEKSVDTLFVFIHARVLRDDDFKDLKTLSSHRRVLAELPGEFPTSEPVAIQ